MTTMLEKPASVPRTLNPWPRRPRLAQSQDEAGQELLQYIDEEGNPQDVTSSDVNAYLNEITGKDITAKDFRTWAGTVLAAMALSEMASFDSAAAKRNLRSAIEKVAARLGNTPTICRKCYCILRCSAPSIDERGRPR
jgi:DNA topoisomerase IB